MAGLWETLSNFMDPEYRAWAQAAEDRKVDGKIVASTYNFDDIYNDFMATTGLSVNNAFHNSGYEFYGWTKSGWGNREGKSDWDGEKYVRDTGSHAAGGYDDDQTGTRYTFNHQKWAGDSGPMTSSGMFGEGTDAVFGQDLFDGAAALAPGYAAQTFLLNRQAEDQSTYENWSRKGSLYQAETDLAFQNAGIQDEKYLGMQAELDTLRAGIPGSTSKATSVGAYSQAAKRNMQHTQRTIASLNAVTSPNALVANTSFIDPVSGKSVGFTDEFDEEAMYNAIGTIEDARNFVTDSFNTRVNAISDDLWDKMAMSEGFDSNELLDTASELRGSLENAQVEFDRLMALQPTYVNYTSYGGPHGPTSETGLTPLENTVQLNDSWTVGAFNAANNTIGRLEEIDSFARYRTLAELSGGTEGYHTTTFQDENTAVSGTQALMRSNLDWDKVMEDMAFDTHARFEINDLTDIERTREEFNRRKGLAESTATNITRRNEINKKRQQSIVEEKRKYEIQLEQQQQEYSSTLSGYGATESDDGSGITFDNTRPQ